MKRVFKFPTLIIAAVLILAIAVSSTGCAKKTGTKVRLNEVTHSIFYAPQYVAIHLGYFKDEGLEIELINGGGADKVMTALLSGQSDIGFMGPEASIYVYNEGRENYIVNFAQLTRCDGSFLVARQPDPEFTWEKLRGKHIIAGRKGGVPEMSLEWVLRQHNLIPNQDVICDVTVQFNLMAGAFTGGLGDYVALFEPTASMVEKEGKGYIVASIGEECGDITYTCYSANKSYIEKNKDIIQRFTNAIYRGQKWVESHSPEEIAKVIKPSFPDTDDDLLVTVVKRYKDINAWASTPQMNKDHFDKLQDIMTAAGELDKRAPYEVLYTPEFADKAVNTIK